MSDTVHALDFSDNQSLAEVRQAIRSLNPEHVILHFYQTYEHAIGRQWTDAAIKIVTEEFGKTLGAYQWCFRARDPMATLEDLLNFCGQRNIVLPIVHADCEVYDDGTFHDEGPDGPWLDAYLAHAIALQTPVSIYTGEWWIEGHFPGKKPAYERFRQYYHWLAYYPGNLASLEPWNAWVAGTNLIAKQYTDSPYDQSVILPQFAAASATPTPLPDPCEALRSGVRAIVDRKPYRAPARKALAALL